MKAILFLCALSYGMALAAQPLDCDLSAYKPQDGLKAEMRNGTIELAWDGSGGQQLRASFTVHDGQPRVVELAARKRGGAWMTLGRGLSPEFQVTSGKRRLSEQQMEPLRALGIALTPEVIEREQWNAFWDAPLMVPGAPGTNLDVEWTFPLEFAEVVWGDGKTTGRQIISATDMPPFGSHRFRVPFDAAGKKWVRFGVWDSAGNGAFTQPVHLEESHKQ